MTQRIGIDVGLAERVLEYVVETERENYEHVCEENGHDPRDLHSGVAENHVYALALRALGEEYK